MKHLVALGLTLATPALADSDLPQPRWANEQLPDVQQEKQARALMASLRCLVCQGQSIADSDADLAGSMRAMVRTRIAAGERPSEIRAWLVQRYGDWISLAPPVEPLTWPLWIIPVLLLLGGLWLARFTFIKKAAGECQ